ncbi:MAG TPA: 4-alpha-glucanotransferase, partial [Arthrobacter sp.]|nr:4-alpha-glucanotransferase [Arthrobacter sp.]
MTDGTTTGGPEGEDRSGPGSGTEDEDALLRQLAAAHRVGTSYLGWDRIERAVTAATLRRVLAALDIPAADAEQVRLSLAEADLSAWRRVLPPVVVAREGVPASFHVHVRHGEPVSAIIVAEDGTRHEVQQEENWDGPQTVDGVLTG